MARLSSRMTVLGRWKNFQSWVRRKALRARSRSTSSSRNLNTVPTASSRIDTSTASSGRSRAGALVLESTMRLRISLRSPGLNAARDFSTVGPPGAPFLLV